MANPSKKKGTGGENEVMDCANDVWGEGNFSRTSPGSLWDVHHQGDQHKPPLRLLATRPDHGQWLVTMPLVDALQLAWDSPRYGDVRIEVNRYARFALHSIWNKKFGGKDE